MKIVTRILSLLLLTGLATFYVSCGGGGGDDKSAKEKQYDKLAASWSLDNATNDSEDKTLDYPNLVLLISGSFTEEGPYNYDFTEGTRPTPSPWPENGTWSFGANPQTDVIRDPGTDDELDMNYTVTDNTLTITFQLSDGVFWEGGTSRTKEISGQWTFTFTKQ